MGGAEVGGDLGYGPARVLQPSDVAQAAAALASISTVLLRGKFNPIELAEADIYPGVWEDGEEDFQYIEHWYQQLQQFYARAAANGQGLLLAIL